VDPASPTAGLAAVVLLRDEADATGTCLQWQLDQVYPQARRDASCRKDYADFTARRFGLTTAAVLTRAAGNCSVPIICYSGPVQRRLVGSLRRLIPATADPTARAPVIVTVGDVGTGKSTLGRYLVNRLLNVYDRVSFLDTDLGQSEFTPPGLVSLTTCKGLLAGPPYTHTQTSVTAHYLGVTTMAHCQASYLAAIRDLLGHYHRQVTHGAAAPLVINTHGWVSEKGWGAVKAIVGMAVPDAVFVTVPFEAVLSGEVMDWTVAPVLSPAIPGRPLQLTILDLPAPSGDRRSQALLGAARRQAMLTAHFAAPYDTFCRWVRQEGFKHVECPQCGGVCFGDFVARWPAYTVKMRGLFLVEPTAPGLTDCSGFTLDLLNGALVALLTIREDEASGWKETAEGFRLLESCPWGACRTLGLGIVRQIRPESAELHILTGVPPSSIQTVNGLALGTLGMPVHWRTPPNVPGPHPYLTSLIAEGLGCGRMIN